MSGSCSEGAGWTMGNNLIVDIAHLGRSYRLTGFYLPETEAKAQLIKLTTDSSSIEAPVIRIERPDFEKKYGPKSKAAWYSVDVPVDDFLSGVKSSSVQLALTDTAGVVSEVDVSAFVVKSNVDKKTKALIASFNRFVIQGNDLNRAYAMWTILRVFERSVQEESADYLTLLSYVAARANELAEELPALHSFDELRDIATKLLSADPSRMNFILTRTAVAYGFDADLVRYLESEVNLKEQPQLDATLPLVVMYLKHAVMRMGAFQESSGPSPDDVGNLFKRTLRQLPSANHLTVEIGEKLCTVSYLYHRIMHIRMGVSSLKFEQREIAALGRRLFIASFGLLYEQHCLPYLKEQD